MTLPDVPDLRETWKRGLPQEIAFWRMVFETGGPRPDVWRLKTDPHTPLQPWITRRLDAPEGSEVHLLDVGSGPLTLLGKVWPGRTVRITATDVLADEYNALIDEFGVQTPVRPIHCETERLTERFDPDTFDLVYAKNCIDHCYDPILCLTQMLLVVKPGCFVHLQHALNEGEQRSYNQLHQWNLCEREGRFIIWRPDYEVDVSTLLGDRAQIHVEMPSPSWINVDLRKI